MARIRQNKPIRRSTNASQAKQVNDLYKSHSQLWNKVKRINEDLAGLKDILETDSGISLSQIVNYLKQAKVIIDDLQAESHFQKHDIESDADHQNITGSPVDGDIIKYNLSLNKWEIIEQGDPIYPWSYSHNNKLSNDWMGVTEQVTDGRMFTRKSNLITMGFANVNATADVDIEIYKNGQTVGELVYTWEIRNTLTEQVEVIPAIDFDEGDLIYMFGRKVTASVPEDVSLELILEPVN